MLRAVVVLGLGAAALAGAAYAQTRHYEVTVAPAARQRGYETVTASLAAVGSAQIRIWANAEIDPDCTAHSPGPTLTILEPPAHGTATVSDDPFFMAFPPANPRSACNDRKVPGHQAFYTAEAGYRGHDKVVLQGSSSSGRVRRIVANIDVR